MAASTFRVAVTQHEPIWLNLQATTDKACKLIAEAASKGASLVAFPECWVRMVSIYYLWLCGIVDHLLYRSQDIQHGFGMSYSPNIVDAG
jgi:predicted amidohydrolase